MFIDNHLFKFKANGFLCHPMLRITVRETRILPLKFVCYESIANLMFNVRNRTAPSNIQDLFQDVSKVHYYNTRSSASNNFYTKSSRLSVQANSFSRIGVKVWDAIPQELRNLSKKCV